MQTDPYSSHIVNLPQTGAIRHFPAATFPTVRPIHWLTSHFAVGGYSPLRRLSGMLTAHMTQIAPHNGFTWHPHRGLEIYTYVIDGELYHEDSTGGRGTIRAGEVQRMFSGNYIEHQELNRSDDPTRVIQIWFAADPAYIGLPPHYEQIALSGMPVRARGDGLVREIIGPNGATDSHVDARLTSTTVPPHGQTVLEGPLPDEELFLYVVDGQGRALWSDSVRTLGLYDVMMVAPDAPVVTLEATDTTLTVLSFYLNPFMAREGL